MQSADVVIIGGGIVGSSIAYHLTANGCGNVLVIERGSAQGKGSTGKSMGGVRAQFSTPVSIQMRSIRFPSMRALRSDWVIHVIIVRKAIYFVLPPIGTWPICGQISASK